MIAEQIQRQKDILLSSINQLEFTKERMKTHTYLLRASERERDFDMNEIGKP
jgi:hypothetical protein